LDEYVQENYAQLNQDICSRQLVLASLSNCELNEEIESFCWSSTTSVNTVSIPLYDSQISKEMSKSLFLKDCLKTFVTSPQNAITQKVNSSDIIKNNDNDVDENGLFRLQTQNDLNYEIDLSDEILNEHSLDDEEKRLKKKIKKHKKQSQQEDLQHMAENDDDSYDERKEKNGWLMYKTISSLDKDINKVVFCSSFFLN
jgi:hypothetical protein